MLTIAHTIVEMAEKYPDRPALTVDGETWGYRELLSAASHIATHLLQSEKNRKQEKTGPLDRLPVTAVVAQRHASSYIGIFAALLSGHTYVPINLKHPARRNLSALRQSGADTIICSTHSTEQFNNFLVEAVALDEKSSGENPNLELIDCGDKKTAFDLTKQKLKTIAMPSADKIIYILFTSGSTGEPKGVPITYANLGAYLNSVDGIMDVTPEDCFSQTFELTFDPSVHDMMVCWTHGAHLVIPSAHDLAGPAAYIRQRHITCWNSVPSLAYQIQARGQLTPAAFPSLRWSLFCGEGFPSALAKAWAEAAPASKVENWYGPTEATIVCSRFTLPPKGSAWNTLGDMVPIGAAFPNMRTTIRKDDFSEVENGVIGELYLDGPQVAAGYLNDADKTAESFVRIQGEENLFYRTGDRVVRDQGGQVLFLGRVDHQVKIRGYRVELGSIEAALREWITNSNIIALSWPPELSSGTSVVVAIEAHTINDACALTSEQMMEKLREKLPDYMVPSRLACISEFPKNASGKVDRKGIADELASIFSRDGEAADAMHLSPNARKLMTMVLSVSRELTPLQILQAGTLLASGLDSLSFVNLTAKIEKEFSVTMDQDGVVALSKLSFHQMVDALDKINTDAQDESFFCGAPINKLHDNALRPVNPESTTHKSIISIYQESSTPSLVSNKRANRAMQFIERFPQVLKKKELPLVLAVGSSGIFRGFSPELFDAAALKAGIKLHSFNVGLPAVTCAGLSRLCEFIQDSAIAGGVRFPFIIYELDPMQLSILPPKGEIDLYPEYFSGAIKSYADEALDKEFSWRVDACGAHQFNLDAMRKRLEPKWESDREYEILRTCWGDVSFREEILAEWIKGARVLNRVADRVIGFVHPPDPVKMQSASAQLKGDRFNKLLAKVAAENIELIPLEKFSLSQADFLNINHVNAWSGLQNMTLQLARECF